MYNVTVGGGAAAAVGGGAIAGNPVAKAVLPFTGIAFGLYLAVALGLLLAGFVLTLLGRRGDSTALTRSTGVSS